VLNESDIHSGDFFGVIRLDGLDSMLAFGMGSHTGHTTVALWEETWLVKWWRSKNDEFSQTAPANLHPRTGSYMLQRAPSMVRTGGALVS